MKKRGPGPFRTLHLRLESVQQLRRRILAVPRRVVRHPAPEVGTGVLQGQLCLPLQLLVGERGVGREVEHVPEPPVDDLVREVAADRGAEGLDHLEDGAAAAGAQVPGLDTGVVLPEVFQGSQVATCEVEDVDVVANGSAVL